MATQLGINKNEYFYEINLAINFVRIVSQYLDFVSVTVLDFVIHIFLNSGEV